MRTLQRFATVCLVGAAVAALIPACSSTDSGGTTSAAGASAAAGAHTGGGGGASGGAPAGGAPSGGASATLTGNATNGATAYSKTISSGACVSCHGAMAEGALGPNITGSTTAGIGNWTQAQFINAVRNGKNKAGAALCVLMPKVTSTDLSDQELADIFAFLKTKDSATTVAGSFCSSCTTGCSSDH